MPILLDHQLREQIPHKAAEFPVVYYHDELAELPNWTGPIHWHPDLEIATAAKNAESVSHPATVPTPFLSLSFPARP